MDEFPDYDVGDVMTYRPVTIARMTTLGEVEALFDEHDFAILPVASQDGALLGVVSRVDLLRVFGIGNLKSGYEDVMKRPAAEIMTEKPLTVRPDMRVTRLLDLMVTAGHTSFPVTIGALLLGVITRRDVVRGLRRGTWTMSASSVA
jgi:CBS domain-containing protein